VLTQGIATILEARHLVLLAWGAGKARAVANCIEGPVSAMAPASAIQLHPHVSVIVDEAAATELKLADYYRTTWASKPAWQGL
jgi:glucosamine-6-phosphate deaminase